MSGFAVDTLNVSKKMPGRPLVAWRSKSGNRHGPPWKSQDGAPGTRISNR